MRKPYVLNRKVYKDIKKMDHGKMSSFCEDLYKNGYADGKKAAEGLTLDEVKEVLAGVKGIGEKRVDIIIHALEEGMNNNND